MEECGICAFSYDKRSHKKVACLHETCKNEMCLTCFEKILLDSGGSSQCLFCKKDLFFSFIVKTISTKSLKKFMDNRGDVYLERAKSYLPFLQNDADQILRSRRIKEKIEFYDEELRYITFQNSNIKTELDKKYRLIGVSGRSSFTIKTHTFCAEKQVHDSLQRLYDRKICQSCDAKLLVDNCVNCDAKLCYSCCKLILICNDRKCFACSNSLSLDVVKEKFGVSFFNKFFKAKNPRNLFLELKVEVLEKLKEKIILFKRFLEICVDIEHVRFEGMEMPNYQENSYREEKPKERKEFIKKCPDAECRGFLSIAWKCGLCHCNFCIECHMKKHEGEKHECNEDEKATVKKVSHVLNVACL